MGGFPLISILLILPLVGAGSLVFVRDTQPAQNNAKMVALWTSITTFVFSLLLWLFFDPTITGYQFVEYHPWYFDFGLTYHVGIDGLSLFLILLSTLLVPICILASWESIKSQVKLYMALFLILETFIVGTFVSLNLIVFYVFFEGVLVPMYFLIGIWGGDNRIYAAFKFFLYTFLGSVFMLLAILLIFYVTGTFDLEQIVNYDIEPVYQYILWIGFFVAFAIKVPMWPFHTWLPDAHVEAPTAASVILAGILLKMGGYGFLRFSLPICPQASAYFADFIYVLSIIAVIYASLVALVQKDMKKLIAYSSVAHMGFVTVGIFTLTLTGVSGGIFQMLSHGVVAGALFLCVGVLYDRLHTREISDFGGVANVMPIFAFIFMIFTFATIGVPGTSGFIGEVLVLFGSYQICGWLTAAIALGLILGAAYSLTLYRRVMLGAVVKNTIKTLKELSPREIGIFIPLLILVGWLGLYPQPFIKIIDQYVMSQSYIHKGNGHVAKEGMNG